MRHTVIVFTTFILLYANPAFSLNLEEQIDMEFEWLKAETVQIASKSRESLFDAPSVISLITKEEGSGSNLLMNQILTNIFKVLYFSSTDLTHYQKNMFLSLNLMALRQNVGTQKKQSVKSV